jgi:tryptophan synthase alpha subunit
MKDIQQTEERVVQIDELNLDKECIKLPSDYLKYASLAAEARKDVDEAKAEVDVVDAALSKVIRAKPEKYGLEKVTEAGVNSAIVLDVKHQKALQTLHDAKYNLELIQAVVSALDHKKRSLTLLVELHGLSYFSEVKLSKDGKEAVDAMTKRKVRRSERM